MKSIAKSVLKLEGMMKFKSAHLFVFGLILYAHTLQINYFFFDDKIAIQDNPIIRNPFHLLAIWTTFNTRFVPGLTFALNYSVGQLNPFGYHFINILLHIGNAFLVYELSRLTLTVAFKPTGENQHSRLLSFLAALFFLAHPIQTDAVNYISQRTVILTTFFYQLTLVLYLKNKIKPKRLCYAGAIGSTIVAMFCKEIAFTLPFMILLYEILFFDLFVKLNFRKTLFLLPFLLTLIIIPATLLNTSEKMNPISKIATVSSTESGAGNETVDISRAGGATLSRGGYFLTELNALRTYWRLLWVPVHQNAWYDYPSAVSFWETKTFLSFLLHLAILWSGFVLLKYNRVLSLCIFAFYLTLAVESTFVPIGHVIAEYRLYLPMVFFSLLFTVLLSGLFSESKIFYTTAIGVIVVLSALTLNRNEIWCDQVKMWEDIVKKSPGLEKANTNLGYALVSKNKFRESIVYFEKALSLNSTSSTYNNLGSAYIYVKDFARAKHYLLKSIEIDPGNPQTYFHLGFLLNSEGVKEEAISYYEKSIELDPANVALYSELCPLYLELNQSAQGIDCYQTAISFSPENVYYHFKLIEAFLRLKDKTSALKHIELLRTKYNQPAIAEYLDKKFQGMLNGPI